MKGFKLHLHYIIRMEWDLLSRTKTRKWFKLPYNESTDFATLPTESNRFFVSYHKKRVIQALAHNSPLGALRVIINTFSVRDWNWSPTVGTDMDPFGCGPLLALNDWAAPMQTSFIGCCVGMQTEEQQCISLGRFHYTMTIFLFQGLIKCHSGEISL